MKNSIVVLKTKRMKDIPKKYCVSIILLGLFCGGMLFHILAPVYSILEDTQEISLNIASIHYKESSGRSRSTGLEITAENGQVYYLWYPKGKWLEYADSVEMELFSGKISTVNVICTNKQSLQDQILNRKRIVDLRSDASVYYGIDTEQVRLRNNYICLLLIFPVASITWGILTYMTLLGYGVLSFKKRSKKHR